LLSHDNLAAVCLIIALPLTHARSGVAVTLLHTIYLIAITAEARVLAMKFGWRLPDFNGKEIRGLD